MIKWHTLNDVFEAFYNQSHRCIKGPRNRTFEACISILIRKCFQRCLNLAYANLWRKKNIPLFYKYVATYKNCPKTTLILLKASGKIKVEFIIAPAGFWPRGRNPRRHPRVPRAYVYTYKRNIKKVFAPAGFWPRGQNPRRHPRVPRVYVCTYKRNIKKVLKKCVGSMEIFSI